MQLRIYSCELNDLKCFKEWYLGTFKKCSFGSSMAELIGKKAAQTKL